MQIKKQDKYSLVSVIIPLYNAQLYIFETIESVLAQTYKNLEVIVVDDCSTDNSISIVQELIKKDNRLQLIKSEENFGGPARPRNIGIKNSQGKYIAFLDADDVWHKSKIEKQLKFLEKNSCDIVHSLANTIDENSVITGIFKNQNIFNKFNYLMNKRSIIYYTNYININSVLMKNNKELLFNEDKNLIALEDWKFWMESIWHNKKIMLLEEILLNYRVHKTSISNRHSDIGYRKSLYMLSLLLLNKEIPLRHYIFGSLFNVVRIVMKKI